jgi:hypothetical protein
MAGKFPETARPANFRQATVQAQAYKKERALLATVVSARLRPSVILLRITHVIFAQ